MHFLIELYANGIGQVNEIFMVDVGGVNWNQVQVASGFRLEREWVVDGSGRWW